jgi:hypothetical protein
MFIKLTDIDIYSDENAETITYIKSDAIMGLQQEKYHTQKQEKKRQKHYLQNVFGVR